jgi:hypothetical protein
MLSGRPKNPKSTAEAETLAVETFRKVIRMYGRAVLATALGAVSEVIADGNVVRRRGREPAPKKGSRRAPRKNAADREHDAIEREALKAVPRKDRKRIAAVK